MDTTDRNSDSRVAAAPAEHEDSLGSPLSHSRVLLESWRDGQRDDEVHLHQGDIVSGGLFDTYVDGEVVCVRLFDVTAGAPRVRQLGDAVGVSAPRPWPCTKEAVDD